MSARDATAKLRAVCCAAFLLSWWCPNLAAAVSGPPPKLLPAGVQYEYDLASTVLVDGSSGRTDAHGGPVGHRVVGRLIVTNHWSAATDSEKLLQMHVSNKNKTNYP